MTVKLAHNGSVLAQNAVIYSQCLEYQRNVPESLKQLHAGPVRVRCCQKSKCNAPKRYRLLVFQQEQQMLWKRHKMDENEAVYHPSIANSEEQTPNIDMHHYYCNNARAAARPPTGQDNPLFLHPWHDMTLLTFLVVLAT